MNKSKKMLGLFEEEKVNYTPKVDKIIYSELTRGFEKEDWINLGVAALDQADFPSKEVDKFVGIVRK
jgi:hypothetical protein